MKRFAPLLKLFTVTLIIMLATASQIFAQSLAAGQDDNYAQVISKRAGKIVAALHISDTVLGNKIQGVIANQYYYLSKVHDKRNAQIKSIKAQKAELTADDKAAIQQLEKD